jgi:ethanolamine permease
VAYRGYEHRVPRDDRERAVGVEYVEVEVSYFERRQLRRHAGVGSLWALGVGAVISGDFFGWNFGLAAGGFSGLLVATGIITLMYAGLCFSIAEMSPGAATSPAWPRTWSTSSRRR